MLTGPTNAKFLRGTLHVALLVGLLVAPVAANAAITGWGPQGGFGLSPDQIVVGLHVNAGEIAPSVELRGGADVGFGDNVTTISGNGDAVFIFGSDSPKLTPFLGGGLVITYWDFSFDTNIPGVGNVSASSTEIGAALVGGVDMILNSGRRLTFTGRVGLGDVHDFKVLAAWMF